MAYATYVAYASYLRKVGCRISLGSSMSVTSYDGFTVARTNLKPILDTARTGRLVTVTRGPDVSAVVSAVRLRQFLAATVPSRARVVYEDGACVVFIPGLAVAAEASTFDEAITEMLDGLRDYAEDWDSHLADAPNHAENWGLVNLVRLSDDDQLRAWLLADQ